MAGYAEPVVPAPPDKAQEAQAAPRAISLAGVREVGAVVGLVALADVTLYRGAGYAGLALLVVVAPLLLLIGSPHRQLRAGYWIVSLMLVLLAARMLWLGSYLTVGLGATLVIAYALTIRGLRPYVPDVLMGFAQLPFAGMFGLVEYQRSATGYNPRVSKSLLLHVLLPAGAVALFGTIFVLANPDLEAIRKASLRRKSVIEWNLSVGGSESFQEKVDTGQSDHAFA